MPLATRRDLSDRLRAAIGPEADLAAVVRALFDIVPQHVPFDFACFAATDPASGVITRTWKSRELGVGDEGFVAAEYGPADVNKFEEISRRRTPVGVLSIDTGGRVDECHRFREYLSPQFGFTDELRTVFLGRAATWGVLALHRGIGDPHFTADEARMIGEISRPVADAIQRALFRAEPGHGAASDPESYGPAVLIVDPAERAISMTPAARTGIDELGGLEHESLPGNVLAVVATVRYRGEPFHTRIRGRTGRWLSLRAAPLDGRPAAQSDVVVTIEPTPRAALSRLTLAAHGLTAREEDVAVLVLQGANTRGIAAALHLSPHTVQDHLKTVFTKLGVTSRREMTARLVLDQP